MLNGKRSSKRSQCLNAPHEEQIYVTFQLKCHKKDSWAILLFISRTLYKPHVLRKPTLIDLVASLSILPQSHIVIWQGRHESRHHTQDCRCPKLWVTKIHHSTHKVIVNKILSSLHAQHGHYTHTPCRTESLRKCQAIPTKTQEKSLER